MWINTMATRMGDAIVNRMGKYQPPSRRYLYGENIVLALFIVSLCVEDRFPNTLTKAIADAMMVTFCVLLVCTGDSKLVRVGACFIFWLATFCVCNVIVFDMAVCVGIVMTSVVLISAANGIAGFFRKRSPL